jgi:hypothetical protein
VSSENKQPPADWSNWNDDSALFADETILQLTEQLQPSGLLGAVSAGCSLSQLHAHGVVHGDLHTDNAIV